METLMAIYSFLFETFAGLGVLVLAILIICVIASIIMERKTRQTFVDRGPRTEEDDDFTFFDED